MKQKRFYFVDITHQEACIRFHKEVCIPLCCHGLKAIPPCQHYNSLRGVVIPLISYQISCEGFCFNTRAKIDFVSEVLCDIEKERVLEGKLAEGKNFFDPQDFNLGNFR